MWLLAMCLAQASPASEVAAAARSFAAGRVAADAPVLRPSRWRSHVETRGGVAASVSLHPAAGDLTVTLSDLEAALGHWRLVHRSKTSSVVFERPGVNVYVSLLHAPGPRSPVTAVVLRPVKSRGVATGQ